MRGAVLREALLVERSRARSQGGRLVSAPPPTSPGSAGGAHGRLSGKFAACCSPLRSCSHASLGGSFVSVISLARRSCAQRSSRGTRGRRRRHRCRGVRLSYSDHRQRDLSPQVRCCHSAFQCRRAVLQSPCQQGDGLLARERRRGNGAGSSV